MYEFDNTMLNVRIAEFELQNIVDRYEVIYFPHRIYPYSDTFNNMVSFDTRYFRLSQIKYKSLFFFYEMNKKRVNIKLYIQFVNCLLYDVKLKGLDKKNRILFKVLNDDILGMYLVVVTDWYLKFYDYDDILKKWRYFKRTRFLDKKSLIQMFFI